MRAVLSAVLTAILISVSFSAYAENAEPFGLSTETIKFGAVVDKWEGVRTALAQERKLIAGCRTERSPCTPLMRQFLTLVDIARSHEGRERFGLVNREVNLFIFPTSDIKQYGVVDLWSSPLQTLATRRGDCEDYAILKYAVFLEAGVALDNLRLLVVRSKRSREDHAVLAAHFDGTWWILNNRTHILSADVDFQGSVTPLFTIEGNTIRKYLRPVS